MKVLINAVSARRGGIVTYTRNLMAGLRERDVEALFAVPPPLAAFDRTIALPVEVGGYGPLRRLAWEQVAWRRQVKRIAPDLLFSSANFGLLGCPVPQILLMREGGLFDPFYLVNNAPVQGARRAIERRCRRELMLMAARRADRVVVPSAAMRDLLLAWVPEIAGRCIVNPYGTVPAFYDSSAPPRAWRAAGMLRLLYVSVYYPHKDPAVICAAAERLNGEGIPCHATITMDLDTLWVRGSSFDRLVLGAAERAGLLTLGRYPYSALPPLYRAHDVFVFPSVSETFGHPMAEALGSGLPVVAADTAINREICGEAALYFRPFAPSDLAARIRALDADPALRERLRRAAAERARTQFDWHRHVDRLVETFETVIEERRARPLSLARGAR